MGKKPLDHDDMSIWKKVTDTVTPILRQRFGIQHHSPDAVSATSTPSQPPLKKPARKALKKASPSETRNPQAVAVKKKPVLTPADLDTPGYGGISRAGARSIKSGQSGFSRTIDLHGLSREKAQIKLGQFLQTSAQNGHRHVLVITGKGSEGKGVIRSYFPVWLNEPPLSDIVIAYCQAQPKDGGSGAWYVNLRS